MKLRTKCLAVTLSVAGFAVSAPAWSVTYSYTGNAFNSFSDSSAIAGSYSGANSVTGSFDVATALAGGLSNQNIDGLISGFSFSDGRTTLSNATAGVIFDFFVSTNGAGDITAWNFLILTPQSTASIAYDYLIETCSGCGTGPSARDRGRIRSWTDLSPPRAIDEGIGKDIGDWSRTAVPEPGSLALLGLGLLGLGVTRRKAA